MAFPSEYFESSRDKSGEIVPIGALMNQPYNFFTPVQTTARMKECTGAEDSGVVGMSLGERLRNAWKIFRPAMVIQDARTGERAMMVMASLG